MTPGGLAAAGLAGIGALVVNDAISTINRAHRPDGAIGNVS
jgi:hypothetical protein